MSPRPRRQREATAGRLVLQQVDSLHARLVARDESALAELIRVTTPWLLGITQAMLSDSDEAEEVVQETFTIAWNRIELVSQDPRGLIPWLLRVARNRAIDRLRARRRSQAKAARFVMLHGDREGIVSAVEPDEAGYPGWHVHRAVHAALDGLPPEQQAVIDLAFFRGHTHSEVAAELGIPLGTVKTRLRLAAERLRVTLAPLQDWLL